MTDQHNIRKIKQAINRVIREKGRFPTVREMCTILSYSAEQTMKYMEALAEDGFLERTDGWYKYPDNDPLKLSAVVMEPEETVAVGFETDPKITKAEQDFPKTEKTEEAINVEFKDGTRIQIDPQHPFPAIRTKPKKEKRPPKLEKMGPEKKRETVYGVPIYVIQIVMGAIGIGAAVISTYYTTVWLLEFLPWGFALLLSSIMVGFSITAFETIILFMTGQVTKSEKSKNSIVTSFIILWILVTSFSIMSTIAGQYNKHIENLREEKVAEIDVTNTEWNLLQERKSEVRSQIKTYKGQIVTFDKIASGIDSLESRKENQNTWREIQYRIKMANREIKRLSKDLDEIRKEEKEVIKKSKDKGVIFTEEKIKKIPNFYGWLSDVLSMDEKLVQFLLSLFPAIFVDVISPVGIAIALFLRSKYRR